MFHKDYVHPKPERGVKEEELRVHGLSDFFLGLPVQYAGTKRKRCTVQFVPKSEKERVKLEVKEKQAAKAQQNLADYKAQLAAKRQKAQEKKKRAGTAAEEEVKDLVDRMSQSSANFQERQQPVEMVPQQPTQAR